MERANKDLLVDEFRNAIKGVQAVVLTEFRAVTVAEDTALRRKLRDGGVSYKVIKNTLAKRAIAGSDLEVLNDQLFGPTAWAYSTTDPVAPAKLLVESIKPENAERLKIRAGYLSGKALDPAQIVALAKLPGRDELRAKFLGVLSQKPTQLLRVLSARSQEFLLVLKARSQSLSA